MRRADLVTSYALMSVALLVVGAGRGRDTRTGVPEARILANDNRSPAGHMVGDTLVLELEARRGDWFPGAD